MSARLSLPASLRAWLVYEVTDRGQEPIELLLDGEQAEITIREWAELGPMYSIVSCDLSIPDYIRWDGVDPVTLLPR